ncbi:MAG TPA: hypothetical protein VHO70_05245 [Chitinispirillaceae bacterium]|nr:hypothetical protein [Chitinispirillaceae bacterium]
MPYNPSKHHRHSIRLKGYDYSSPGYYFITSCTQNRISLFGKIVNGQMILNGPGTMVKSQWELLPQRFNNIRIDEFVVMPDHFHAILQIVSDKKSVRTIDLQTVGAPDLPTVGAPLVGAPLEKIAELGEEQSRGKGQPQGIAPTVIAPTVIAPVEFARSGIAADGNDRKTVGDIVGAFHSIVTVEYIRAVKINKWPPFNKRIWQRNYWEHIIRNDLELFRIRNYIRNNPKNWDKDDKTSNHCNNVEEEFAIYGDNL